MEAEGLAGRTPPSPQGIHPGTGAGDGDGDDRPETGGGETAGVAAVRGPHGEGPAPSGSPPPASGQRTGRRLAGVRPLTAMVAAGVLALTGVLTWLAAAVHQRSEQHLLELQVRQAAAAVRTAVLSIQPQLLDALQVAVTTHSPAAFEKFAADKVDRQPARPGAVGGWGSFVSISVWQRTSSGADMLGLDGTTPRLVADHRSAAYFAHLRPSTVLQVVGVLPGDPPVIGFAVFPPGDAAGLVVYAEHRLPSHRRIVLSATSAFKDLDFGLYLGKGARPSQLIEASAPVPIIGRRATTTVPLGDRAITVVGTPTSSLDDPLSGALPWLIVSVGVLLAAASATTVEYVLRRRAVAERFADENQRLYVQQRDIAETLQRALLTDLPFRATPDVAARYLPGVQGIDVGGDWYDVVYPDEGRCSFVVGDVSGRGLKAATTMASLRFATRAYVVQGDGPGTVLAKLDRLLHVHVDHQFATVLVGEIDLDRRRLTFASAGHFPPVLLEHGRARLLETITGPPIGIGETTRPPETELPLAPGAALLAFTDGLVERRGEHLDTGLQRLVEAMSAAGGGGPGGRRPQREPDPARPDVNSSLRAGTLVDVVAATLIPDGTEDDVVILGLVCPS